MKSLLPSLVALWIFSLASSFALEIVAHRGASYDAPENTIASFKLGWEQGADADELDIYLTKDGQAVVIHDATVKRTTGAEGKVAEMTFDEVRALDAGSFKGPQWAGEKIPTLAEALATMPDGKKFFIEIKCGPEILPELERVMKASGKKTEQLVIIGFGYETMRQARLRFPQAPIYLLSGAKEDKAGKKPDLDELIAKAQAAGLTGLDLDFKFPIDAAFVAKVKAAGLRLYTWTVDDLAVAKAQAAAGVDGVTTNRPAWLRAQLAEK